MKVGIDFDNTIVSYDNLFYKVALELGVIPKEIHRTKISVRDFLRKNNKNDVWTSIQGTVYGEKMIEAEVYDGFIEFIKFLKSEKIDFCIISPGKGAKNFSGHAKTNFCFFTQLR